MNIKKGDKVRILCGKNRGKTGKVMQAFPRLEKLSVDGVNLTTKNLRARRAGEKGQRIQYSAPISVANVQLVCPKCDKVTRVAHLVLENGKRQRQCKKCKASF